MVSIYNVGIPLAFSFSVTESVEIYQRIYDGFKNNFSIDLSDFIFESDQGKSLQSFFEQNNIKNIVCIRHLLSNLMKIQFGFQISTMVKCRCQVDLDTIFAHFANEFEHFLLQYKQQCIDAGDTEEECYRKYEEMKNELNNSLKKVGLCYTDQIIYKNQERWNQVSLFSRIPTSMPSTTNSLEASHGHLNERVPRRHNFYNALAKLMKWMNYKLSNFEKLLQKNFNYTHNKMKRKLRSKSIDDMKKECTYYQSSTFHCNCGEVAIESSMYKTQMKCSHMLFKCVQKGEKLEEVELPKCPQIKIKYKNKNELIGGSEMSISFNLMSGEKQKQDYQRDEILIKHAARTIKKYTHCKDKLPQIIEYVDEKLRPHIHNDTTFIGQFPLCSYSVVSGGIYQFSGQIKSIQQNDDDDFI